MMDRDYKVSPVLITFLSSNSLSLLSLQDKLPAMQVEFIDTICLPVYTNLVKLSDNLQPMLHGKIIPDIAHPL